MQRSITSGLMMLLLLMCLPAQAQEQEAQPRLFAQVRVYYQGGQFEKAEEALHDIVEAHPNNARAHYLLSRLYYDSPLKDLGRSSDELHRALEIEPNNVQYMVARLQFLQRDAGNFIVDQIRDIKRRSLALEILAIDSTNSVAHEVLGVTYVHDFWRYRNAISLPFLQTRPATSTQPSIVQDPDVTPTRTRGEGTAPIFPTEERELVLEDGPQIDPTEVFVTDRFDIERFRQQGIAVQDLSSRGDYAYNRAIYHLKTALKYDPRRRTVYDHLMEIYALRDEPQVALDMLGSMYIQFPEDPKLWLYLGYAHYETYELEAAAESFREAFAHMTPEEREAYQTLKLLLLDEEEAKYEANRKAFAEKYWLSKDPRYLTDENERKLEHYSRLVYADLLYGVPELDLRGWDTQRGQILIRYGVPELDVTLVRGSDLASLQDLSTASFTTAGASSFGRQQLSSGNTFNIWDYGEFRFVFEDPFRNREYRLYSPPASAIAQGAVLPWANDYVLKAEETFREVPDRYDYEAPGREVDLPYIVSTFKGEGGKVDVYVHYGIPITQAVPEDDVLGVTVNIGTFLIDPDRNILAQDKNTVYGLRQSKMVSFDDVTLWTDTKQMTVAPGELELSMEFETAGGGAVGVQRRDITAPDYTGEELAISDLLLAYGVEVSPDGQPLSAGEIVREGLSIRPAPWSVFSNEQPIYLYFEAYNLEQDASGQTRYEVKAILVPKDDASGIAKFFKGLFGGEEGVSVEYDGTGTTPDASQYLILDAKDREPGLYTLVVQVHDTISGETAQTERDLYLE